MLDKKDLEEITRVFKNLFKEAFAQVWEHNIQPALDDLHNRIDELPTKDYVDKKFARQEAIFVGMLVDEDDKVDRITEILHERDILNKSDMKELENFQVFSKKRKST